MIAIALAFSGESEEEVLTYASVEACIAAGVQDDATCHAEFNKAKALHEEVAPRWWTMRITRADGSVLEGLRMNEDTFTVRIMDADENLWNFLKSEIRSSERIKTSTMPTADGLTAGEMDDLIAYVFSLRRES